jgi:hypothetical protein
MDNFDLRKYLAEGKLLKEEIRDVEDILVKAGFRFDDGILGGIGSGGAGYYDNANDLIYHHQTCIQLLLIYLQRLLFLLLIAYLQLNIFLNRNYPLLCCFIIHM